MSEAQLVQDWEDCFEFARRLQTAVWLYDFDNARIVCANSAACALWQAESELELTSRDLSKDMSVTVARRLNQYKIDFETSDATFNEMWTLYPDGEPTSVLVNFTGCRLWDGRMAMQCEAITKAEDEPENLRSAEALLHTDVFIALFAANGPPLYMNPAARNEAFDAQSRFNTIFSDPDDHTKFMFELDRKGEYRTVTKIRTTEGKKWFDLSAKSCRDAVTGEPAILATAIDVSELKTARDTARYLADRDQLTGCYNRSFILNQYTNNDPEAVRPEPCVLLYFDVDRFKLINDSFGHEMGDKVLKEITARTQKVIRNEDVLVRLGGDEFIVLFRSVRNIDDVVPLIERLRAALSCPLLTEATKVNLSVSIGAAQFDPRKTDFASALHQADTALYTSKQNGRDRFTIFNEEMGRAAKARDRLEIELRRAMERKEFELHFQPRFDLKTRKVVACEALVRWQHPERGLVLPGEFIPICEQNGMIEDLGRDILQMGIQQATRWWRSGCDLAVSVNISPRQFQDERIFEALSNYAAHPDFRKGKFELEITESVLAGDHQRIAERLEKITSLGYLISIDDFGSGYSNLAYISRFPLHYLKIDRSFVTQLPTSGPIIRLIITLAKQIGAAVVAEGVENEAELEWLTEQDCDQIQGFLLCKPVDVFTFEEKFLGTDEPVPAKD